MKPARKYAIRCVPFSIDINDKGLRVRVERVKHVKVALRMRCLLIAGCCSFMIILGSGPEEERQCGQSTGSNPRRLESRKLRTCLLHRYIQVYL